MLLHRGLFRANHLRMGITAYVFLTSTATGYRILYRGITETRSGHQIETFNRVWINTGVGWATSTMTLPLEFRHNGTDTNVRIADVDGDGLSDLIKLTHGTNPGDQALSLNKGNGWTDVSSSWSLPHIDFYAYGRDTGLRTVDLNSDNVTDLTSGGSTPLLP